MIEDTKDGTSSNGRSTKKKQIKSDVLFEDVEYDV